MTNRKNQIRQEYSNSSCTFRKLKGGKEGHKQQTKYHTLQSNVEITWENCCVYKIWYFFEVVCYNMY